MVDEREIEQDNVLKLVKEFDVTFDTNNAGRINTDVTSIIKD